ncbi:HAD family phosphatase [Rhodobacteraceae bacterium HSP-20]|uniref:HAD family phosphatase n=1 Tax=Paragemmobacter amnigenus TaxID=2852097 RepID=A0ABS6J303_9RHOB|nr:HAD family phosphatase [Rhodobacter amnigenus]MBU9697621.1 HAD family phosphatase [Rhodobacter amnigenus]MBV4388848.1 HAD family phosphatase [Rhodobacter amnigenus]
MRPAAVIFDCDGVVVDSEHPTLVMVRDDLERYGLRLTLEELEAGYIGGTVETVAEKARANGARLPEDWVSDFYARMYAMLRASVPLVKGIVGVLDALDSAGIPYAMGSNGTPEKMQITLGQHGLIDRFRGHLYSGQALGRPKPAPDLYLHAAGRLGVEPSACVVVEDSAAGARAARAAGMRCFGYAPRGVHDGLLAEGAILFNDMAELPALLGV